MYTWTGSSSLNTICTAVTPQATTARYSPSCHHVHHLHTHVSYTNDVSPYTAGVGTCTDYCVSETQATIKSQLLRFPLLTRQITALCYYAGNKHHLNNNTCVSCREKTDASFCHVPFNEAQCKQLLGTEYGQCLGVRSTCCVIDL
jgi:hypothetical protein